MGLDPGYIDDLDIMSQDNVVTHGTLITYSGNIVASDRRLKNILGDSDSANDLAVLRKIEITDYRLKDACLNARVQKKVLAQQLKSVFPNAVRTIGAKDIDFIPNIFAPSTSVCREKGGYVITLGKAHGLNEGDKVRLMTAGRFSGFSAVVHPVSPFAFRIVSLEPLPKQVFVYGKECPDLLGVDYSAVAMLGLSATQALAHDNTDLQDRLKAEDTRVAEMDASGEKLLARSAALRAKLAALEKQNRQLQPVVEKIERLKKSLTTLATTQAADCTQAVALRQ